MPVAHPVLSSLLRFNLALAAALACLLLAATPSALAQDAAAEAGAKPEAPAALTADPALKLDHLKLLLDPLTKDELLVEAEAWRDLLQANVQKIAE